VTVWAVRDFDVGATEPARVRLRITADEEYVAYLNGRLVGVGEYARGAPLDQLEVSAAVKPGWNRLVVELRSARGAGGLLASLYVDATLDRPATEPTVRSDASWRIYRRHLDGLLEGWRTLDGGESAAEWQVPPTGRWRVAGGVEGVPPLAERLDAVSDAVRIVPLHGHCEAPCAKGEGVTSAAEPLDRAFLVDFGESATGFLELEVAAAPRVAYELRLGDSLHALVDGEGAIQPLIVFPDAPHWLASRARRFRYAMVLGVESLATARRLEVKEEWCSFELARGADEEGLFGITPRSEPGPGD
jgi:hypothetical protein